MKFPLALTFKTLALAPQISVTDADGQLRLYVKQKLMKLKESVNVFADEAQSRLLYTIKADRVFDVGGTTYTIADAQGAPVGALRGVWSLWKAHYDILREGQVIFSIREENPWVKVIDGLVGDIPVLGLFSGYLFHPAYSVTRPDGTQVLRLVKQPAFLEGKFEVEQKADLPGHEEGIAVLSLLMMTLLMRQRG